MHHRILVKVHGEDVEDARAQAKVLLEETIRCPECGGSRNEINWDYVGDIWEISKESLKKNPDWGYKTPEEMVKHYIRQRTDGLKQIEEKIKEKIRDRITLSLLTKEEAPPHIDDPQFKDQIEKLLKDKIPNPVFPTTPRRFNYILCQSVNGTI